MFGGRTEGRQRPTDGMSEAAERGRWWTPGMGREERGWRPQRGWEGNNKLGSSGRAAARQAVADLKGRWGTRPPNGAGDGGGPRCGSGRRPTLSEANEPERSDRNAAVDTERGKEKVSAAPTEKIPGRPRRPGWLFRVGWGALSASFHTPRRHTAYQLVFF